MIIECTSCRAKYQYDEDRFERKPSKKIKCAKCQTVFEIHNPAFAPKAAPSSVGEATGMRRGESTQIKSKPVETTTQSPLPTSADDDKPEVGAPSAVPKLPAGKRLSLAIIDGPDAGSVHRVEKPRVTIGRSGADITINDTESSRNHAALEVRETIFLVSDLGSTNGTLVNGEKIKEPVEIQNQGEFQIGATTLMLIVTDDV